MPAHTACCHNALYCLHTDCSASPAQWLRYVEHSKILHSAHTVYLCVLCGSENKQRLFQNSINWLVFVTETECLLHGTFYIVRSTHTVYLCFVCISEQTAIISLYSINWLVFITETECLLRGTSWGFKYRVFQEKSGIQENDCYVKLHRYNQKHLYKSLNIDGDNGIVSFKDWDMPHIYCLPNTYETRWNLQFL